MGPREFHAEISSTQDRAIALAREGAEEGTRVVALRQTGGRGRLDHVWESPVGGLYLSILLPVPPASPTLLPLALGARLAQELGNHYSLPLSVKWPNDVLATNLPARPRKIAGVLVDRVDAANGRSLAVAGIGVNVANAAAQMPRDLPASATSLADLLTVPPNLDEVEGIVVRAAMKASIGLRGLGGPEATRALCRRRLYGIGRRATVDGQFAGTIAGLGDEGELLLDREGERVTIRAGDLRVEETP